jgi:endonuclease VIII
VPEGDTVWRTAQRLDAALSGRRLTVSDFRVPRWAELDLTGQTVLATVSRGKHLLTRLSDVTIHTHLKMEGSWHVYARGARWRSPGFQARVVLANAQWQAIGFRLGVVDVVERASESDVVGHLGPDLLGPDWSLEEAILRLTARPERPIGEALLDQRNLAGIGNMYKAEVCFLSGVSPFTPVASIDRLPELVGTARRLLLANKARAVQSTTGSTRRGESLWVYARRGQPCRRCATPIRAAESCEDGIERVTYWCPSCQPAV